VSAVADPNTGVAVYDSTAYQGLSGWLVFGGTSVASPIIASVYALAGNTASIDNNYPYSHTSALTDVTSGSNGTCTTYQWCNAGTGWDGPTGLGTPDGVGAF
jgi:subtilase family serine protease